jgi:hypothetical protein
MKMPDAEISRLWATKCKSAFRYLSRVFRALAAIFPAYPKGSAFLKLALRGILIALSICLPASAVADTYNPFIKWNIPGGYPLRMTVTAEIEGQVREFTRVLRCHKALCFGANCRYQGYPGWTQSVWAMAEPVPTGGGIVIQVRPICSPVEYEGWDTLKRALLPVLGWVDRLDAPREIEVYDPNTLPISDYLMERPRVRQESIRATYERLEPGSAEYSDTKESEKFYWFPNRQNYKFADGPLQVYLRGSAQIIPRDVWSAIEEVQRLTVGVTEPKVIGEFVSFSKKTRIALNRNGVPAVRPLSKQMKKLKGHGVPLRYLGENLWELDEKRPGLEVRSFVGTQSWKRADAQPSDVPSNITLIQRISIAGRIFDLPPPRGGILIFDPAKQRIVIPHVQIGHKHREFR